MIVSIGVLIGWRVLGRGGPAGSVAAIVGTAAASQYLFLTAVLEARFLLPTYAVLAVAMLAALPPWRSPSSKGAAAGAAIVLLLTFVVFAHWQVGVARRIEAKQFADRQLAARLVAVVRRQRTTPCFVASDVAFPVIAFGAGCRGAIFHPSASAIAVNADHDVEPAGAVPRPPTVYVLTRTDPAKTEVRPKPGTVRSLTPDGAAGWWLFVASESQVIFAR
jgi:hypothetical protein